MPIKISTPDNSYTFQEGTDSINTVLEIFELDRDKLPTKLSEKDMPNIILRIENWLKYLMPKLKNQDSPQLGSAPVNILGEEITLNVYQDDFHEFVYEMGLLLDEIKDLGDEKGITIKII
jgi:predicted metal-dependent hydrolase